MTKNVTVFDSEGMIIGKTYPKRAAGLVKNGRARYCAGSEPAIILSRSPDIETSEEDETMSNYTSEELREKIEEMVREAREKLDTVCKNAADAIDDLVDKIEEREVQSETSAEEKTTADEEAPGEEQQRVRLVRISDEDMEKLRARMKSLRDSLEKAGEEAKAAAIRTGAEIGKYAENVKARVAEKLAEQKAASEAKLEAEKPGTEAYYLRRIEEIGHDASHFTALENTVTEFARNATFEEERMSDAVATLAGVAQEHECTNRKLLDFYISQLEAKRHEHE